MKMIPVKKSTLPDATELESKIGSSWEAKQEGDFKLQRDSQIKQV